jgi:glycine oxidase
MRSFDVAVAGGGLIGGAIALELARAGLHVGLLDRQEPGQEASWASAGILSPAPESPAMIPLVPLGKASMALYPSFIEMVEELSGLFAGFRPKGTLQAIFSRSAREELNTIVALHHGLSLQAEPLSGSEARELEPALSDEVEAAVLRPAEASVDNRCLTRAVLLSAQRSGVELFPGTRVDSIWRDGSRCLGLIAGAEKIAAQSTVIAAGSFSAGISGVSGYAPVRPAKGQMISLRCENLQIERVLWSENIYLVPRNDGRILAGATVEDAGFDKTVTAGGIFKLCGAALELIPGLKDATIVETWAGSRPDSPDHLPILGPVDLEGLLFATGHFRSGILLTPITAKLIREWITQNNSSLDCQRFSPLRFQGMQQSSASFSASSD